MFDGFLKIVVFMVALGVTFSLVAFIIGQGGLGALIPLGVVSAVIYAVFGVAKGLAGGD
jgi:hypothetical protein